jgi:hypothetical protein
MLFTHRPLKVMDLEACFEMLQGREAYLNGGQKDLLKFWKLLVESRACVAAVVEDQRFPAGKRQVAFGITFFATDEFIQKAKTKLPPYLTLEMIRQWRRGKKHFLLNDEIEEAVSGEGLNALILHHGWDVRRLDPEEAFKAHCFLQECFMAYHAGYPFKELLQEVHGPEVRELVASAGEKLRRDYREYAGKPELKGVGKERHPYLLGCNKEEAWQEKGSFLALLFAKMSPARFYFKPAEREILEEALKGGTDEDIAEALHLSPWTVKKRWQTVYDKVVKRDPGLLTEPAQARPPRDRSRMRRRYLLEYLRSHPEELRPSAHSKTNSRKK